LTAQVSDNTIPR